MSEFVRMDSRASLRGSVATEAILEPKIASQRTLATTHRSHQGQASLEMAAAMVVILILLVASVKLFAWLNASMVYRQADYERTRVEAGSTQLVVVNLTDQVSTMGANETNESAYPRLNIFE